MTRTAGKARLIDVSVSSAWDLRARNAIKEVLAALDGHDDPLDAIAQPLIEMADEIGRLKGVIVSVRVDRDNQIREASGRALDCTEHGKVIAALEGQVAYFDRQARSEEDGRRALLSAIERIRELLRLVDDAQRTGRPLPSVEQVLEFLREKVKIADAAHKRAWSR